MEASTRLSKAQQGLLAFLREKSGQVVTQDAVLAATGWKPATLKAYVSKGNLAELVRENDDGSLLVISGADLDPWTLLRTITQSGSTREVGGPCESNLARALVRKARDNMTLALELYNRPALENRLDAFCILFCTAWEQLLKAEIVEEEGEDRIFTEIEPGQRPKTISLEKALDKRFPANDPVRANIAEIAELRHGATHLLMPEAQSVLSRLFQAGVLNFTKRFPALGGVPVFPQSSSGLLSLIADPEQVDVVALRQTYGAKTAEAIAEMIDSLKTQIEKTNDERFAISVEYKLVLTRSDSKADIRLTTASSGTGPALLIEKPVAVEKSHPHALHDLVGAVNKRAQSRLNDYDVQAVIFRENWKAANNEFHYYIPRHKLHFYSEKSAVHIADKIGADPEYIARARESYRHHLKKQSRSSNKGK